MSTNKLIGTCKYCGELRTFCNAHIIPKHFYRNYPNNKYISVGIDGKYQFVQSGIWDNTILCSSCDKILGKYDEEAYKLFFNKLASHKMNNIYSFNNDEYDYRNLRCFFISMLWRASITNRPEFKQVILGKYNNLALRILQNEVNDNDSLFNTIVCREPDNLPLNNTVCVIKARCNNKILYRFHFSQFIVIIIPSMPIENISSLTKERFMIMEDQEFYNKGRLPLNRHIHNRKLKIIH